MRPNFELFGCSGFSENSGRLMENIFFLELKRARNDDPALEIYLENGAEVDFLLKEKLEIKQFVQVCYDLGKTDTEKRELKESYYFVFLLSVPLGHPLIMVNY